MPISIRTMPIEHRAGLSGRHIVTKGRPATDSGECLVTGNGTMQLHTQGNPSEERLLVMREELWSPQWETPPSAPLLAPRLDDIRALILEGKYAKACQLSREVAEESGTPETLKECPGHPALDLVCTQPVTVANDYLYTLDLRTSRVTTRWTDVDGVYTREYFASRADDLAAVRVTAPRGRLEMTMASAMPPSGGYVFHPWSRTWTKAVFDNHFSCVPVPPDVTVRHTSEGILSSGVYAYSQGGYSAVVRATVEGGSVSADENGIRIAGADSAVFLIRARRNEGEQPEGDDQALLDELIELDPDFDALLARHVAIHQPMFDRVSMDLGGDPDDYLLTGNELKRKQFLSQTIVPAYAEMMLDRGRFFLLNECGKFPPIYGHVNVNVNHQISSGNIGALPEMMESFFRWIEWQLPDARENAQRVLGARGFFLSTHPDEESGKLIHFAEGYPHQWWISSSGWCLQPFLEHYQCTGDEMFLRERMVPLYKELFLLYQDFLTVRDEQGKLMFIPSYSPENWPDNTGNMTAINAVMDISICREVLETLLTYAPLVDAATDVEIAQWQEMLDQLPPYLLDDHGELKEWAREGLEERYDHRHSSHLYGAYPGHEFQPELNPAMFEAASIANRMRAFGNESFHGIGHRAQAAARLKDAWLFEKLLRITLECGYVNDSFTTAHNPYRISPMPDAQGALPTMIMESLLYSRRGFIEPLPALPKDSFPIGSIRGMRARTNAVIDELSWDLNEGTIRMAITSPVDQMITVCCRMRFADVACQGAEIMCEGPTYRVVNLRAGQRAVVQWFGVETRC